MYFLGRGIRQDHCQAFKWLSRAAQQGIVDSQQKLGSLLAQGLGVERDLVQALTWSLLAAKEGDQVAAGNCEILRRHLTAGKVDWDREANTCGRWRYRSKQGGKRMDG
jgi:TPR repeat protein